jgi:tRNA A-37 threonylcarbamoyl transferase component Bud32
MTFAQPFKDYEILDRVGAGAMGTVFKARHKKLGRIVALKVLRPSLARDARYVDRLRREARIVASLNHPNIVTGYDLGEEGSYHYFVMEFVEGKSLRSLLAEWGVFPEERVLEVATQAASALDHAWQRGVIHRDIKPGNILIDESGAVKLTDMGLAKGPADLALTRDGATVGTPQYISPEQARNPQDVDVRSDLYSLGATLYHMATGVPPFHADSLAQMIDKVLHETPPSPRELNVQISEGFSLVLRKLLAKDVQVRYQTPRELLDDLERVSKSLPPAVDESRLVHAESGPQPNVWIRSLAVVAGAVLLALAVWVGAQLRSDAAGEARPDGLLANLDRDLAAAPTPFAQWTMLAARTGAAPTRDTAVAIEDRRRVVRARLQQEVDAVAAALQGPHGRAVSDWLCDPALWLQAETFVRERIEDELLRRAGCLRAQLPAEVRQGGLDELTEAVRSVLARRDQAFLRAVEEHLTVVLPLRAAERLRHDDFAGAERTWQEGLLTFCDGVRQPKLSLLDESVATRVHERHAAESAKARAAIDAAEAKVAEGLRLEAHAVLSALREQLEAGTDPDLVAAAAERSQEAVASAWPPASRFRALANPWPEYQRLRSEFDQRLQLALGSAAQRRQDLWLELAWGAVVGGATDDALALLGEGPARAALAAEKLEGHRQAIRAVAAVEQALIGAIESSKANVLAFPRRVSGRSVELVVRDGRLLAYEGGGATRRAALTEFRFVDLLQRLRAGGADPLAGLPAADAQRGCLILGLIGDELSGLGDRARGDEFVSLEVWPRILRVRASFGETATDRTALWRRVREGFARLREQRAEPAELEAAIAALRSGPADLLPAEQQELARIEAALDKERNRAELERDIGATAPSNAAVAVQVDGDRLRAKVAIPVDGLRGGAHDGWHERGQVLEFGGVMVPWAVLDKQSLAVNPGLRPGAGTATIEIDLLVPPAEVGLRLWLLEFSGVGVLLTVTADDAVRAALVDDVRREAAAKDAFRIAMEPAIDGRPPATFAIPGAVHCLRVAIAASPGQRRGLVRVFFDQDELCAGPVALEPDRPPLLTFLPQQEVGIKAVRCECTDR